MKERGCTVGENVDKAGLAAAAASAAGQTPRAQLLQRARLRVRNLGCSPCICQAV